MTSQDENHCKFASCPNIIAYATIDVCASLARLRNLFISKSIIIAGDLSTCRSTEVNLRSHLINDRKLGAPARRNVAIRDESRDRQYN